MTEALAAIGILIVVCVVLALFFAGFIWLVNKALDR